MPRKWKALKNRILLKLYRGVFKTPSRQDLFAKIVKGWIPITEYDYYFRKRNLKRLKTCGICHQPCSCYHHLFPKPTEGISEAISTNIFENLVVAFFEASVLKGVHILSKILYRVSFWLSLLRIKISRFSQNQVSWNRCSLVLKKTPQSIHNLKNRKNYEDESKPIISFSWFFLN